MAIVFDEVNETVEDGMWTEELHGCKFLVASTSSTKFQRILNRLNMPYRRKLDKGNMDPKDSKRILCKAMAKGLLLDWTGITDKNGVEVSYDVDKAELLLGNNDEVREYISDFAADVANYFEEERAELVKN